MEEKCLNEINRAPLSARPTPKQPATPLSARPTPKQLAIGAMYGSQPSARRSQSARPSSGASGARRPSQTDPLLGHGYQTLSPIAQGAFSQVMRACHLSTQQEVAVKTFNKAKIGKEPHLAKMVQNELDVLKLLQPAGHANIANILEVVESKTSWLAILEYCGGGSLQRCLQGRPHATGLGEAMSASIGAQVGAALAHMHGMGVAHRDVKPENVLFVDGSHSHVKLVDFGFAVACHGRRVRTICGSPAYMAPELSKREPYHAWATDVWAYACLLFELLEGRAAFRGSSMEQLTIRIVRASHEAFTAATPPPARTLIKAMLQIEPLSRLPLAGALEHAWLGGAPRPPQPESKEAP